MSILALPFRLAKEHKRNYLINSSYAVTIVLFLFILQLLIAPLTFSRFWHCPMMTDMGTTMSMNMDDCIHMQGMDHPTNTTSQKQNPTHNQPHNQHGIFICPLCNSFALPSPLLGSAPILPSLTIALIAYQQKPYYSHAPPTPHLKTNTPRAPPIF